MPALVRRAVSGLLLLLTVAVAAVYLVPKLLGYDLYVITTGSMAGTADPGALVVSERVPAGELAVGDVITFVPPAGSGVDHLVTHRITGIAPDGSGSRSFTTRGDANASTDPWTFTLTSDVQPRMVWTAPALGTPVLWLADPEVRRAAIGVPAVAIALLALADVVGVLRPRRPEAAPSAATSSA